MKILTLIIIFISFNAWAGETEEAIQGVQKAILSYPIVKKYKKALEKKIIKKLPVDKETAGVIGSVALSASQGYIDTKVIKHINIKIVGGDMRPNVRYNFKSGEAEGTMDINWNF
mgnify:CR=1 FL=1